MKAHEKKIIRLGEIRKEISKLYAEKSALESEVVDIVLELGEQKSSIQVEDYIANLLWVYEKKIDYEKLKEKYPDVYELGLITEFSAKQALKGIDRNLFNKILNDCIIARGKYEVKVKKGSSGKNYGQKR